LTDALFALAQMVEDEWSRLSPDAMEEERAEARHRRVLVYEAVASTGGPRELDVVKYAVLRETNPAQKSTWLRCLAQATRSGRDPKLIGWLVEYWNANPADGAVRDVLTATTGRPYGRNRAAWTRFQKELEAAAAAREQR
jgi:hypothetical protein